MSRHSFVFSPSALRSLERDQDLLEQHQRRASCHLPRALPRSQSRRPAKPNAAPTVCHDVVTQNALYTGDLEALERFFPPGSTANLVIEPLGGDMRWAADGEGIWSLTYEQELTTPLHITAGRGFAACLRLLLRRGALVDLAPDGITALHEACESCEAESCELLLAHGADANAVTEDGRMPLHMCSRPESLGCAKCLLQYGAAINGRTLHEDDTPLHVAARHGLEQHVALYLRYGAAADRRNDEGLTPLNAACSQPQEARDVRRYWAVCKALLEAGADPLTADQDRRTPLHMACKNVNADVVDLLLAGGASVNDMDYGGEAPMHNVLKVVCFKAALQPERVVRALLNHGSIRVWPGALPLVLQHCSQSPRTIEVLLNAYSHLKVTDKWAESVPPEALQEHGDFFQSVFSLAGTPRSLQHLARCRVRTFLEGRVHKVVPTLDLPTFIKNYLLLDFRGFVH